MWISPLRTLALACLPPGATLRTDRADALYLARGAQDSGEALARAGFAVAARGASVALALTPTLLTTLSRALPTFAQDPLRAQLARMTGQPTPAELALVTALVKALEVGPAYPDAEKRIRQSAARCLRTGGGGALALARRLQLYASTAFPPIED
ncbi:MAG: hypothetical protein RR843_07925 [Clostridia bacterium]